jgi:deaminated glutathione amidase
MRVAAIQTTAGPDRRRNLDETAPLVHQAAAAGAGLVVLPEYFSVAGSPRHLLAHAEDSNGPTRAWASDLAARLGIHLLAGSVPERPVGDGDNRLSNTSHLFDPTGSVVATYRKIHLFDVALSALSFRESAIVAPGRALSVAPLGPQSGLTLGLSICYDIRFPEPYRIMTLLGAAVIAVPAAFTAATGPAHWELLLRARAVENQVFIIGAGQVGDLPAGMPACHGHSMIVDPWGTVLAERHEATPGVVTADLDVERQQEIRAQLPVLANRQPAAYRWPGDDASGEAGPEP